MSVLGLPARLSARLRLVGMYGQPDLVYAQCTAWARSFTARGHYRLLDEDDLRATKRTDTVFVFGSGYSINDLTDAEWKRIAESDTLSFNWFPYQDRIRIDYHLIREVTGTTDTRSEVWRRELNEYSELIRRNPYYSDSVFLVQKGWRAINGNRLVGLGLLPHGARIFRFMNRARGHYEPPSESLDRGLVHSATTVGDCINFAYLMGWRSIVLVGVDMYDHRYFWLGPNEERAGVDLPGRGVTVADPFQAADRIVETLGLWAAYLADRGVVLSVYNPRSLLAAVLPVHERLL